ncbi:MAG TPA: hypothetical protein VNS19_18240 [Acidimicrobiales bacterium]|nr:hypothetical protein [Acidimicrobiales bacterium]
MRRGSAAAIVLGALLVALAFLALVPTQAPSRDEVHTAQQVRDRSLSSLVEAIPDTPDRSPPAYYLAMWAATPATGGDVVAMRVVSVGAWVLAAALLGSVVRRHGAGWPAVLAATVAPTATGLGALGTYARPYALCFAALCALLEAWDASLARSSRARVVRVLLAGSAAVLLNYLAVLAVGCVLVAELLVRRRDRTRGWGMTVALAATAWPVVASLPLILGSVDALQDLPRSVTARSFPSWYLSVLGPLVPGAIVLGMVVGVTWLATRDRSGGAGTGAAPASTGLDLAHPRTQPLLVASGLLVVVLPSATVAAIWVTSGAYLYRYSIGALAGLAVLVGAVVARLERWRRWAAVAGALLVVASIPLAVHRASDDRLPASTAEDLSTDLGLESTSDLIAVSDEYVYVLLREDAPASVSGRTVLGGPATFARLVPTYHLEDIDEPDRDPELPEEPFVVVADRDELAAYEASGRIEVLEELGAAHLRYGTTDRTLVAARVASRVP